ncbi:MAG TPA: DegV family protein, partial [Lachnospiraceae bacterium]|nr:DegV family protein [Lachnospiraceae bacterium]
MSYKIVGDSCCDYTTVENKKDTFIQIPLTLDVDGFQIRDDDTFEQIEFLKRVAVSKECPRSACPAPEEYMKAYEQADDIYVVTLSSELSGSYNSAVLAKNLYEEEHGTKNIHVFNSKSASSGQLLICRFIEALAEAGTPFEEVVERVEKYI